MSTNLRLKLHILHNLQGLWVQQIKEKCSKDTSSKIGYPNLTKSSQAWSGMARLSQDWKGIVSLGQVLSGLDRLSQT